MISEVKKEANRTLSVELVSGERVSVSRYRRMEFLKWFEFAQVAERHSSIEIARQRAGVFKSFDLG